MIRFMTESEFIANECVRYMESPRVKPHFNYTSDGAHLTLWVCASVRIHVIQSDLGSLLFGADGA